MCSCVKDFLLFRTTTTMLTTVVSRKPYIPVVSRLTRRRHSSSSATLQRFLSCSFSPAIRGGDRCCGKLIYNNNNNNTTARWQSSKNSNYHASSNNPEAVEGLSNDLRDSIARLRLQKVDVQEQQRKQQTTGSTIRRLVDRALPQAITFLVSSAAVIMGIQIYYYQKTNKALHETVAQQQTELQARKATLIAVTQDDFVQALAEKCAVAAAAAANTSNTSADKSSYGFWGRSKVAVLDETQHEQATAASAVNIQQILRQELEDRVGEEGLNEHQLRDWRERRQDAEESLAKERLRAQTEGQLDELRRAGNEIPQQVIRGLEVAPENVEVTTDSSGKKVIRNKIFKM